jgi:hypothetical protein
MADSLVQVLPDSTGKKVDTSSLTVGANTVERQRMNMADPTTAAAIAAVMNSLPAGTEYGLVVRDAQKGQTTMASSRPVVLPSDQVVNIIPAAPAAASYLPVRVSDGVNFVANPATYYFYQNPRVTTAAATDFFDLFNASGSGKTMRVTAIYPMIQITAASAIIPSFQFSVIKTSAVGTGGTAHTFEGAASPATGVINIVRVDDGDATLPAQVTSRSLPTGGATASKFLFDIWLLSEETNSATYQLQGTNFIPLAQEMKEIIIPVGQGIKIRQITATASTGTNFGWLIVFTLV